MIRCLLSALIVQWENFRGDDRAKHYVKQLTLSTSLVILLKKVNIIHSFIFISTRLILGSLSPITINGNL
jgi:hypothetical protein